MHGYRLSRFDTTIEGWSSALDDQWTEATQLGSVFNGTVFELDHYLAFERAMIDAVLHIFNQSGLSHLRMVVSELEVGGPHSREEYRREYPTLWEADFDSIFFSDDRIVDRDALATVLKMMLRQIDGWSLCFDGRFYLHIGDDSLVEIMTKNPVDNLPDNGAIHIAPFSGIGTYMPRGTVEVLVDVAKKGADTVDQSDLLVLSHLSRRQLRDLLGVLSKEHSFVTAFRLTKPMAQKLKQVTDYQFDLKKYDYFINTYGDEY